MNIKMKIDLPRIKYNNRLSGVYKITFDNGCFYIGSSCHLKRRALGWSAILRNRGSKKMKWESVIGKIKECTEAIFEVIQYTTSNLIIAEEGHIKLHSSNPNLLNTFLYSKTPTLQYTKNGVFVARFESMSDASRKLGCKHSRIRDVVSGRKKYYKGFAFIAENPESVKPSRKKVKANKVYKYNRDGIFIEGYTTYKAAGKSVGVSSRGVYSVIKGIQKTAGGHIFKLAMKE